MILLWKNSSAIGGFPSEAYWSSSENDIGTVAWSQEFNISAQHYYMAMKDNSLNIRCVRRDSDCVEQGLVSHWMFDQPSGSTSANDWVGMINGSMNNMDPATDWVAGKSGNALDFDGIDDRVAAPLTGFNNVTIAAWIYPRDWGSGEEGRIVKNGFAGYFDFYLLGPDYPGNDLSTIVFQADWDTNGGWAIADNVITLNEWQHVAVTYDGSSVNDDPIIYINGVAQTVTEAQAPSGSREAPNSTTFIGGYTDQNFDGIIDDVRIYNRILSADEISAIYNGGDGCFSGY
jgi:hypothetical protein